MTIKSASFPRDKVSQFLSPIALAPPSVAILSTSLASTADASFSLSLAREVVRNISLNISRQLLLAGPSVPIAMLIPFFINFEIGATPLANLALEPGLVTTDKPCFSKTEISSLVIWTQ